MPILPLAGSLPTKLDDASFGVIGCVKEWLSFRTFASPFPATRARSDLFLHIKQRKPPFSHSITLSFVTFSKHLRSGAMPSLGLVSWAGRGRSLLVFLRGMLCWGQLANSVTVDGEVRAPAYARE